MNGLLIMVFFKLYNFSTLILFLSYQLSDQFGYFIILLRFQDYVPCECLGKIFGPSADISLWSVREFVHSDYTPIGRQFQNLRTAHILCCHNFMFSPICDFQKVNLVFSLQNFFSPFSLMH